MKNEGHIEDELLGRWLAGELSGEELKRFESSDAFKTYGLIAEYSEKLETPAYDDNAAYERLKQRIPHVKARVVRMRTYRWVAVAASVIVLLGIGSFFYFGGGETSRPVSVVTAQGETQVWTLPKNSRVELNAASSIAYDKSDWEKERKITLKGEAYFDVTKGNKFTVETNSGTIEVLGTTFNIRERNSVLEVVCYSGKVKVTNQQNKSVILKKGDAARIMNGQLEAGWNPGSQDAPSWQGGVSSFHEASFENVILELENQYGIKVIRTADFSDSVYYGAFPHNDLDAALKQVFYPMKIFSYEVKDDTTVVIQ